MESDKLSPPLHRKQPQIIKFRETAVQKRSTLLSEGLFKQLVVTAWIKPNLWTLARISSRCSGRREWQTEINRKLQKGRKMEEMSSPFFQLSALCQEKGIKRWNGITYVFHPLINVNAFMSLMSLFASQHPFILSTTTWAICWNTVPQTH